MGGDFSGKNQDCAKGVYALAGKSVSYVLFANLLSTCVQIKCVIKRVINLLRFWFALMNFLPSCSSGCISHVEETQLQEVRSTSVRDLL